MKYFFRNIPNKISALKTSKLRTHEILKVRDSNQKF